MEETNAVLRCGFGKKEITPPLGTPLVGYYRPRFAKGVLDPLFARATLFQWEDTKALLLTLDICLLSKPLSAEIRGLIAEAIGLCAEAIHLSVSHTHTGPLTGKDFASDTSVDPSYLSFLKECCVEASLAALADLAPAQLFYAKTEAKGISFVRRYRMKDGKVKTNPTPLDPMVDAPLGSPNEDLRLLKIQREGAGDLYLVNFGTHPDTVGGEYVSADWPGYVCSILESAIPGSACMFLLGPQGDVNHFNAFAPNRGILGPQRVKGDPKGSVDHARYMGRVIAGQILSVCDRARPLTADAIRFASAELLLPTNRDSSRLEEAQKVCAAYDASYQNGTGGIHAKAGSMSVPEARRIVRMKDEPDFYPFSVYAIRLGDFAFAGLPGEPFTEIGRRIYENSPFETMILTCQTNASCGYIGTATAYDEGGYEALTSSYKKGVDDVMAEGMLSLLKQLQ
jgi:hypothetical protein